MGVLCLRLYGAACGDRRSPCRVCTGSCRLVPGRTGTSEQPWSNHGHDRLWLMSDRPAIPDGAAELPARPGRRLRSAVSPGGRETPWWQRAPRIPAPLMHRRRPGRQDSLAGQVPSRGLAMRRRISSAKPGTPALPRRVARSRGVSGGLLVRAACSRMTCRMVGGLRSSRGNELIHVKRARGSSPLSHLFSQALVSAQALATSSDARAIFMAKVRAPTCATGLRVAGPAAPRPP